MAKDHSHKSAVEPTGGSTLEVVDVDRKPSYPVAALEPKHVEPHSFDSMTQVVTYLRDKLRDTPLVSPEESAAEVFKMLNRDLTQTERDALFKLLLVREAHQAGLFPKKPIDMNALSDKLREGAYPYKNRYPNKLYEKELYDLQVELLKLQDWVKRTNSKIIVLFEGRDAAGKGGNIKRVAQALDARAYTIFPSPAPTKPELAHPFLWRYWTRLPKAGHVGMYDRSWYGRVLVERVEGFATPAEWSRAYDEINEFEHDLVDWGAILLKFWVDVSPEEQLRRFQDREDDPAKQWKITEEDWRNREKWDAYEEAVDEMLIRTSTTYAPWIIVEGNNKYYARIKVLETVVKAIEERLK